MRIYTVSEFREELNELLSQVMVAIEGEVSDFHISQNRFVWFTLADKKTSVSCFMLAFQLHVPVESGMKVRVIGAPTMFTKGKLVFRPKTLELIGEGTLQKAYELLKAKLTKEGLFDESRKRTLPRFPAKIGLVTSKDAAAYTDVLRILNNRWAGLEIYHANVNVQGTQAVDSIVAAIAQLNEDQPELDAIILTRGGGSLEDLQAFNTEEVVRAIFASDIPIICAVGHERDTTLSDLVADVRASTPSNAAERVVPHKDDVLGEIQNMVLRTESLIHSQLTQHQHRMAESVNVLELSVRSTVNTFHDLHRRLQGQVDLLENALGVQKQQIDYSVRFLQSMNPYNVLQRGYTLVFDDKEKLLKTAALAKKTKHLKIRFADGTVQVNKV